MKFAKLSPFSGVPLIVPLIDMPVTDEALQHLISQNSNLAVFWTDLRQLPTLRWLEEALGPALLVRECWQKLLPCAGVMISSSLSGGCIAQRFEDAVRQTAGRCWLLTEPMQALFSLPSPHGEYTPAETVPSGISFYSRTLGCRYIHQPGQIILYDTAQTINEKVRQARIHGFLGTVQELSSAEADTSLP